MPNLKEIRARISSVGSTMQITSAMKMVSAAKLKRAQDSITQLRPYSNKLTELLNNLSSSLDATFGGDLTSDRGEKNVLIIAITSNRGLCGAFNTNIIKKVKNISENKYSKSKISLLTIGKKGSEFFARNNYNVISSHDELYDELTFENSSKIAESIINSFLNKKFDKVILVYNQFKNAATQIIVSEQFLPIKPQQTTNAVKNYIFEPNQEEIVSELIPKSLKSQFFKGILDSYASEHGARMTAMHKATDNAGELKRELTLTYNKARQAAITGEILEIVGGAEALQS
ncbi:MAG: ATP synthase F1 subunit gamma [Flavobacteriales bacterium]|nr:ATP synthase F1 subunit gamma [Flavobacteriales bacterium]